ncbi:hypothetical protein E18064_170067 [Elizabethkingia anophelis]|nr:hypothetical protein E18064_170067 [Elizabethkingia anophelis]
MAWTSHNTTNNFANLKHKKSLFSNPKNTIKIKTPKRKA